MIGIVLGSRRWRRTRIITTFFCFSAFKRSPETIDPIEVTEWMIRCLLDVWKKDPYITPYYSQLKNWTESEWYEFGNNSSIVWRHFEEKRIKVGIWDIMDGRSYD